MRIPLRICGFHLQFADSTYSSRIPLTVADSATAQLNYTHVLLFVCGFHKLLWIPQTRLRISQIRLFLERFWTVQCFMNPKQQRRSKKHSNVAESATNLIWACCGIRLQCTECTVWTRNVILRLPGVDLEFSRGGGKLGLIFKKIQKFCRLLS